jgi:hypothetical protein
MLNYEQQELATAQKNQGNLISMAEKTSTSLLDTYKKMYPQTESFQNNSQNHPVPSSKSLSRSSLVSKSATVTESFTNLSDNIKSKQMAYKPSVGSLAVLRQDVDLINQKSRLLMDTIKQKQLYIEFLKLGLLSVVVIGFILLAYMRGWITMQTALILLVLYLLYLSYQVYLLLFNPLFIQQQLENIAANVYNEICNL